MNPVCASSSARAPDEIPFRYNEITDMVSLWRVNLQFNSFVPNGHFNIEVFDAHVHGCFVTERRPKRQTRGKM